MQTPPKPTRLDFPIIKKQTAAVRIFPDQPLFFSVALIFLRHDLDPIAVGIGDEVDPHGRVFKADAAHVLVLLVQLLVLIGVEGQVELALAQVVGLLAVPQPGQLQLKLGEAVPQVHQTEGAVLGVLHPYGLQAQGFFVEVQALVQIQDIKIEVVEFDHMFPLIPRRVEAKSTLLTAPWRALLAAFPCFSFSRQTRSPHP